jgi:O-antigen/teichoic acid export membrane protein
MDDNHQDSVLQNIARYSSSKIYQRTIGLLTALIKPKLLTPELYGLWNILALIPLYASYSNLGSYDAMRLRIPYHESRKEHLRSQEIAGSVLISSFFLNMLVAVVLIVSFFAVNFDMKVRLGLLAMAIVVMLAWYYENNVLLLKAYQNFQLIAWIFILQSTITFFLSIFFIYMMGIYGAYLASILSLMVVIIVLKAKYSWQQRLYFRWNIFMELMKIGFPIMIYNFSFIIASTSDRIVVSYFLGNEQLGYYGVATLVFGFLLQVPAASREVIEPKLMQSLSAQSQVENLKEYFFRPLINTAYYMSFLVGFVFLVLPVAVPLILPRYSQGILPAQIITLGGYFVAMSYTARAVMVANNWQSRGIILIVLGLIVNIVMNISLIFLGYGLIGVSIATSVSYLVLFIGLFVYLRHRCDYAYEEWRRYAVGSSVPLPIALMTIFLLQNVHSISSIYMAGLVNVCVFSTVMLAVLIIAGKRYPLLQKVRLKRSIYEAFLGNK